MDKKTTVEQGSTKGLTLFNMSYGGMSRQGQVTKRNRHCLYPNCHRKGDRGFFAFPSDENQKSKWLRICGLSSETTHVIHLHVKGLCGNCCICSVHFSPSDINLSQQNILRLKTGAVPLDPSTYYLPSTHATLRVLEDHRKSNLHIANTMKTVAR